MSQLEDMLVKTSALLELRFKAALDAYLETRRPFLSKKTMHEYELCANTLAKFFGMFYLTEIDGDMIRKYQRSRQKDGVGASGINHETSLLQQVLKRIGRWIEIAPDFQPLKLPKWKPGRIITEVERQRLFRIAKENPQWEAAYLFAVISVNSTCGPKEIATLRHQDVNLGARKFQVQPEGAKRDERVRILTLNDDAWPAMTLAVARANRLGSTERWHYIFPARNNHTRKYDPTRYQGSFKTAWLKMVKAADLVGLKMYDLRRTAITDLLADPENSEETVIQIAGHVSRDMLKHYSYPRIDKIRGALDRLGNPVAREVRHTVTKAKKSPHRAAEKDGEFQHELSQFTWGWGWNKNKT